MKYSISINHEFKDLDDLARYFADVMTEVEIHRDELVELDTTIAGKDWDIEAVN